MSRSRRFTKEFEAEAVRLVQTSGRTQREVDYRPYILVDIDINGTAVGAIQSFTAQRSTTLRNTDGLTEFPGKRPGTMNRRDRQGAEAQVRNSGLGWPRKAFARPYPG